MDFVRRRQRTVRIDYFGDRVDGKFAKHATLFEIETKRLELIA